MRQELILEGVARVAERHLDWEGELRPEMHLVEDLELDSLKLLTLAVEIENHFRICLDEEDEAAIETVADLVQAIERKVAG
jgi:acyl carrier protein